MFFRFVPRGDPAGSCSAPQSPNTALSEIVRTRVLVPRAQKKPNLSIELSFVIPLGQNSNLLLVDLRRLNQLKDTLFQSDLDSKKVKRF